MVDTLASFGVALRGPHSDGTATCRLPGHIEHILSQHQGHGLTVGAVVTAAPPVPEARAATGPRPHGRRGSDGSSAGTRSQGSYRPGRRSVTSVLSPAQLPGVKLGLPLLAPDMLARTTIAHQRQLSSINQ